MAEGILIQVFVNQFQKHKGILLYEWLLERAKEIGIHGGSAFKSIAGFGSHQILHEEHFYELASNVAVMVCFAVSNDEAKKLVDFIKEQKVKAFWVSYPISYESQ